MFNTFKKRMDIRGQSNSQAYLNQSKMIIDQTFTRDPAFKEVYLTHIPSEIDREQMDAKFFIHTYRSITGDTEDYYLQFRPGIRVPIGSYVDIPDDRGELNRWLIILKDDQPQFPLYYVLKCNWTLKWLLDGKCYKVLGVLRNQNSYNSGIWTDYATTSLENQNKFWMPTTAYTQLVNYDQRVLINNVGRTIPLAWRVSKIEDVQPIGITKLTFTQELTNLHDDCGKWGLAGWCTIVDHTAKKIDVCKTCMLSEPTFIDAGLNIAKEETQYGKVFYNGKDATLRVGGNDKIFTAMFWNEATQSYVAAKSSWKLSLNENDNVICAIDLNYIAGDGSNEATWNINLSDNCPSGVILKDLKPDNGTKPNDINGCEVCCTSGEREILKIHVSPSGDSTQGIKMRCLQLFSMVGKNIVISAKNTQGQNATGATMGVVS